MAQLGTKKITLPDGSKVPVPIHDPGDVDYPVRRIGLPNGNTGCLPVYPLSEDPAYPERRLYHPNYGVMAYHNDATVIDVIEDWEGYWNTDPANVGPWRARGSGYSVIEGVQPYEGNWELTIYDNGENGERSVWSNAGDGLDHYPVPGTKTEVWWYMDGTGASPEVWFGTSDGAWGDRYQVEYFWDGNFQIRKYTNESEQWKVQSPNNPTNLSANQWYKFTFDWENPGRSNNIWASVEDASGNQISAVWTNDTEHRNGAHGFQITPSGNRIYYDYSAITERY